jgi:hypothetical protein
MPQRGAICPIKGYRAEYARTFGVPCFACAKGAVQIYISAGNSKSGLRWPGTSPNDYEAACARCELHIALNDETRALVLHHLRYDKRDQGSHGRALRSDIPSLGLLANDRIEPCPALPDVSKLENMEMLATIVVWRPSEETVCRPPSSIQCRPRPLDIQFNCCCSSCSIYWSDERVVLHSNLVTDFVQRLRPIGIGRGACAKLRIADETFPHALVRRTPAGTSRTGAQQATRLDADDVGNQDGSEFGVVSGRCRNCSTLARRVFK